MADRVQATKRYHQREPALNNEAITYPIETGVERIDADLPISPQQ